MATIRLDPHTHGVAISPAGYLGDKFWEYKTACDSAGAVYKNESGKKFQLARYDALIELVKDLKELGFKLHTHPDITANLQSMAAQATEYRTTANQRIRKAAMELAKEGKYIRPYQVEDIHEMSQRMTILNANPMGSGKTMEALLSIPEGVPVLCIIPAIARGNWVYEIEKWRLDKPPINVLKGRQKELKPAAGFTLITYSALPPEDWIAKNFRYHCPDNLVIVIDEAHLLKSTKAKRTKKVKLIAEIALSMAGRCWLLTGTPIRNRPTELWNILTVAKLTRESFGTWNNFVTLFNGYDSGFGMVFGDPEPEVAEVLRRVMIRHEKGDILSELPPKQVQYITVDKLNKAELAVDIDWADIKKKVQDSRHGVKFEELSAARAALAAAKIPIMLEWVRAYEDAEEPLVVASAHKAPMKALKEREGWVVITGDTPLDKRDRYVRDFQNGQLKGIGITIKAGGLSISLTKASHMLFVDEEPVPGDNEQCRDRIHRIGQNDPCMYTILVADHWLDKRIAEIIREKHRLIYGTVEEAGKLQLEYGRDPRDEALQKLIKQLEEMGHC